MESGDVKPFDQLLKTEDLQLNPSNIIQKIEYFWQPCFDACYQNNIKFEDDMSQLKAKNSSLEATKCIYEEILKQDILKLDVLTETNKSLNIKVEKLTAQLEIKNSDINQLTASKKVLKKSGMALGKNLNVSKDCSYTCNLLDLSLQACKKHKLDQDQVVANLKEDIGTLQKQLEESSKIQEKSSVVGIDRASQTFIHHQDQLELTKVINMDAKTGIEMNQTMQKKIFQKNLNEEQDDRAEIENENQKIKVGSGVHRFQKKRKFRKAVRVILGTLNN